MKEKLNERVAALAKKASTTGQVKDVRNEDGLSCKIVMCNVRKLRSHKF
jgi:hypothetical protein